LFKEKIWKEMKKGKKANEINFTNCCSSCVWCDMGREWCPFWGCHL